MSGVQVICPKCNKRGLRQQVSVYLDAPAGLTNLSKKGIVRRDVKVLGVGWPYATWYCPRPGCGYLNHFAAYIKDGRLDFEAGRRVRFISDGRIGMIDRVQHTRYTTCWVRHTDGTTQRVTTQHLELLPRTP